VRRTPLRRRKPAALRAPLAQAARSRIPAFNAERRARARAADFGPKAEWIRSLPCCTHPGTLVVVGGRINRGLLSEPSHVRSRGAGGGQRMIPQCRQCHALLHQLGRATFEQRLGGGRGLDVWADAYDDEWSALPADERAHWRRVFEQRWPEAAAYLPTDEGETPEEAR
jgi:hypothetical protein